MKKLYIIAVLLCLNYSAFGQVVNIPDANFKNALLTTNCAQLSNQTTLTDVDVNNDGEIQLSEAMLVISIGFDNTGISSMDGIQSFQNMQSLAITNNPITSLNLNNLPNLTDLGCSHNQLNSLILPHNANFRLDCSYNNLTQLDLNGMNYSGLNISYNQLAEIVIPYSPFYETGLDISGNLYSSIDFTAGEILEFYCNNTLLTHLDLSQVNYFHYYMMIDNNQYLQNLNLKNNRADFCFDIGASESGPGEICKFAVDISGNLALASICVDNIALANQEGVVFSEADYYAGIIANPSVAFSEDCMLDVSNNALVSRLKIYPNPVNNFLYVEHENDDFMQPAHIYNTLGQPVQTSPLSSEKIISIDVSHLKTGTYFIEIASDTEKTTKKFIKI